MTHRPRMAHMAGQGPQNATCGQCANFLREDKTVRSRPHQWCRKAAEMAGTAHLPPKKAADFLYSSTSACKYFIQKRAKACAA